MKQIKLLKNFLNLNQRHQEGLEESMRGSEFVLDSVNFIVLQAS